jgi:hypothetical protein
VSRLLELLLAEDAEGRAEAAAAEPRQDEQQGQEGEQRDVRGERARPLGPPLDDGRAGAEGGLSSSGGAGERVLAEDLSAGGRGDRVERVPALGMGVVCLL